MIPPGLFPQPRATGMCEACLGCTAQAAKRGERPVESWLFLYGKWDHCRNRVGVGSEWPMVAHIRYNREVNLYCRVPDTELERIRHMAATTEHIDNGELYSPETTPPPIEPQEVVVIKNY